MATITLTVYTAQGIVHKDFDTEKLDFTRRIMRQGKGARAAWRNVFEFNCEPVVESHAVIEWNEHRGDLPQGTPLWGIRAEHRRELEIMARRAEVFAVARDQVGGLIIPDEHDPRL